MGSKKTRFRKVTYKGVEMFFHRDRTRLPVKLRLYDAESGWILTSEMTRAEIQKIGLLESVAGINRRELLQLLEKRHVVFGREGESMEAMLARLRVDYPAGEKEAVIRSAYLKAMKGH